MYELDIHDFMYELDIHDFVSLNCLFSLRFLYQSDLQMSWL